MQKINFKSFEELRSELLHPNTSYNFEEFLKIHIDNYDAINLLSENTKSEIFTNQAFPELNQLQPDRNPIIKDFPINLELESPLVRTSSANIGISSLTSSSKEESKNPIPKSQNESGYATARINPSYNSENDLIRPTRVLNFKELKGDKFDANVVSEQKLEEKPNKSTPEKANIKVRHDNKKRLESNKEKEDYLGRLGNSSNYPLSPQPVSSRAHINLSSLNGLSPSQHSHIPNFIPNDMSYENLMLLNSTDYDPGKGFSFEVLSNLNQFIFNGAPEFPQSCNICQDALEPEQNVSLLKCTHIFHYECIYNWLSRKKKCAFNCELEESDFLYD